MKRANCFAILCLLLLSFSAFAGNKNPTVEKLPSWITATTVNYEANHLDHEAQDGYTDLHYELQVSLQQQTVFLKKAVHILSEAGVQNKSQISIDYDPSFQSLVFHAIRIIRGGAVVNKLELSKIKTIQQEKELNRNIYNGSLTAVLFLEDVRKDDIIEYSYTIKGFNPIFQNRYATMLDTQFGVPVYGIYYKLMVPKNRRLYIKNSLTGLQPVESATATETVYEWRIQDALPVQTETGAPSWYDPFPMVMVSEFGTWKEVADWAQELFSFTAPVPANLQKKIAEIKAAHTSTEAQLLAALRFVQDDVRYMGVEMGVNSHKPHQPSQILDQRFGDCKDKAYLLCTLLRGLGIEAYPVLNNTFYKKTIDTWQPSPTIFDHATVCVQLNGKRWWFDPTISYQRGPLQTIAYPDYQIGLVIRPGTTSLTTIPLQDIGKVNTKEVFTVKRMRGPVQLKVTTQFTGSFADNTRSEFKNNSVGEIRKTYKNFYSAYFKKLQMDSLTYQDNEQSGLFTTTEYYTISNFWEEEAGKTSILLEPYLINSIIKKPKEDDRTTPYALSYPIRYHETVEIQLPEDWKIEESTSQFKDAAFSFRCRYTRPATDVVLLEYDYENLADHIQPDRLPAFTKEMNRAEESMAFKLYTQSGGSSSESFLTHADNPFTAAYVLLGLCVVATYLYKRNHSKA